MKRLPSVSVCRAVIVRGTQVNVVYFTADTWLTRSDVYQLISGVLVEDEKIQEMSFLNPGYELPRQS
jgi:hypothetical protein